MAGSGWDGNDFENLARQYWDAWGQAMRATASTPPTATPGWNEALAWWSQLARNAGAVDANVDDTLDRFNAQAREWFGQMQQLAAQFAGKDARPDEVAAAWKQMLGASGGHLFADLFKTLQGPGQHGIDQWMDQIAPMLHAMQRDGRSWLGVPSFGFTREHEDRWKKLAQAQLDYQDKSNAYHALMAEAAQQAFRRFEDKLDEHSEPGRQIASARALFDLWIDAAEEAYAQIALSPRFSDAYGEFINAQMRVRAGLQREVEQQCALLGVPTRTEIDAAHRKIVQLERDLRRLRDALEEREAPAPRSRAPRPATKPKAKPAAKPVKSKATPARQKAKGAKR